MKRSGESRGRTGRRKDKHRFCGGKNSDDERLKWRKRKIDFRRACACDRQ